MKHKIDMTTVLSIVATGLGIAGTVLSGFVNKKQMDSKIAEAVNKAITKK